MGGVYENGAPGPLRARFQEKLSLAFKTKLHFFWRNNWIEACLRSHLIPGFRCVACMSGRQHEVQNICVTQNYRKWNFCRVARGLQAALRTGVLEEGHAMVQDEAAALVVTAALAQQCGDTLLDTCAAPGGKALFAASCMTQRPPCKPPLHTPEEGLVVAMDVSAARVGLLKKMVDLWGLNDCFVIGTCDLRDAAASHMFVACPILRMLLHQTTILYGCVSQYCIVCLAAVS